MTSRHRSQRTEPNRHDAAIVPQTTALKLALTGLAGSSIEWYDFFLYATAAALVFPSVFFPATLPPLVALIASFSTFAVGFLAPQSLSDGTAFFIGSSRGRLRRFT